MPPTKLTPTMRRELTLRALRGETPVVLSREYGISRTQIYRLRDEAEARAEEMYEDARSELEFRREVYEMYED